MVHRITLHIDGAEGSCGAEVLAFAAAYTPFRIHHGHLHNPAVNLALYHPYRTHRAMTRTGTAAVAVGERDAVLLHPHGVTDMESGLLFFGDSLDGTCRAHLAAAGAFGAAETAFE